MHIKTLLTALFCAMLLTPSVSFGAEEAAKARYEKLTRMEKMYEV